MSRIGIIGAMPEEIMILKSAMHITDIRSIASQEFYVGTLYEKEVVLVQGGIGKVNAAMCTQLLIDVFQISAVINTGVAGALSDELEIGDVVISLDAIQHDVDATAFGYKKGEIPQLKNSIFKADHHLISIAEKATDVLGAATNVFTKRLVSGDQFISSLEKKRSLQEEFNGFCVEMEGASIAQVCVINNIPFVIIRSISDKADDTAEMAFDEFVHIAAGNSCRIVEKMLEIM